jgi:septal ring factor EnvC (AmiA/AmiB activator)
MEKVFVGLVAALSLGAITAETPAEAELRRQLDATRADLAELKNLIKERRDRSAAAKKNVATAKPMLDEALDDFTADRRRKLSQEAGASSFTYLDLFVHVLSS